MTKEKCSHPILIIRRCFHCGMDVLKNPPNDYNLYGNSLNIIGGANCAEEEEIQAAIVHLSEISKTGYYDDPDGDILFNQIITYLKSKLKKI